VCAGVQDTVPAAGAAKAAGAHKASALVSISFFMFVIPVKTAKLPCLLLSVCLRSPIKCHPADGFVCRPRRRTRSLPHNKSSFPQSPNCVRGCATRPALTAEAV